jgi:hypothetical protein
VGVDEPVQQVTLLGARLARRPVEPVRRQVLGHRRPGPLEGAVGGGDAGVEQRRGLGRRPAQHVPQDQRRPLPGRQDLQGDQERQLDRLPADDLLVGRVVGRDDLVEQPVRVGLQPRHPDARPLPGRPPGTAPQHVEAHVGGDAVQPGPEQDVAAELVPVAPRPQVGLLERILGLVEAGQHPVAVDVQLAAVAFGQRGERRRVAGHRRGHRRVGHAVASA